MRSPRARRPDGRRLRPSAKPSPPSARQAAVRVLLAVDAGPTTLGAEIDRARRGLTDERDRALLIEIATGVLRWRARLDALLAQCATRPLDDVDAAVRATLRVGAYQIEHLTRIPSHAVVHESVELVRRLGRARASGFVNAVLRNWLRTRKSLTLPDRPRDGADRSAWLAYLSTTLSHPAWLVARWLDRVGPDAAERWCRYNNDPPAIGARAYDDGERPDIVEALSAAGVETEPLPFVADGWRFPPGSLGGVPQTLRQRFFVQDEASQIVAHAVGARPGDTVLDLCAAPGGKSIVLAADMAGAGRLVSCDARPRRLRLLADTLARAHVPSRIVQLDASRPLPFAPVFDRVLIDAPCSGLGVVARDPDLKWTRREAELHDFADQQFRILSAAAAVVRPGGHLVYATCSSEPEENEAVVARFLAGAPDFTAARPATPLLVPRLGELLTESGALRTWPHRHGLDGFFAAFLVRRQAP